MQSQTDQVSRPPDKEEDLNGIPSFIQLVPPLHSRPNKCVNEDNTSHESFISVTESSSTLSPEFLQNQDKAQNSCADICRRQNDTNNISPLSNISATPSNPAKNATKGSGHMNCSWYSAHLEMQRRKHDSALGADNCDGIKEVNEMLTQYSLADIRQKLFLVQKQLCLYHTLLEKYEECRDQKNKLKEENKKIVSQRKKYEDQVKKSRSVVKKMKNKLSEKDAQMMDLKMELAETKVLLAQARGREDHQMLKVMKIAEEKDRLEEENMCLRRTNSMYCMADQDTEEHAGSVERKGEKGMRRICSMLSIAQAHDRQIMKRNTSTSSSSEEIESSSDPSSDMDKSLVENRPSVDENHDSFGESPTALNEQDFDDDPDPADSSPRTGNKFWNISILFNTSQKTICEEDPTQDVAEKNHHDKLAEDINTMVKKRRGQTWEEGGNLLLTMQDSCNLV